MLPAMPICTQLPNLYDHFLGRNHRRW
eukprot:Gb_20710 [translate_table: standard]